MKTPEEIKKGLEMCGVIRGRCKGCPYDGEAECVSNHSADALAYIQQLENREWDLFDLLSSAWYGKGCYFKQEDGAVYSRVSCEHMSFDQAIDEFAHKLTVEGESLAKDIDVPCWISVEERLPESESIAVGKYGDMLIGTVYFKGNTEYWCENEHEILYNVTHWMPLPSMPKEDT